MPLINLVDKTILRLGHKKAFFDLSKDTLVTPLFPTEISRLKRSKKAV